MGGRAKRVTLRSVAQEAGVSLSTASLVFSGAGAVSEATAARVRAAATTVGYRGPDPVASSLRRGRSGVVAVVVEDRLLTVFRDPYAVSRLDGLASVFDEIPASMLLVSQPDGDQGAAATRLASSAFDAAVFFGCGPDAGPVLDTLRAKGVPLVAMDTPVVDDVVRVGIDERPAAAAAAAHLAELGHTRIAQVVLPCDEPAGRVRPAHDYRAERFSTPRDRMHGVADVLGDAVPTVAATASDVDAGRVAGAALLAVADPPTAIVAQSDMLALGVVLAAGERGLDVPRDLSVTGFDGITQSWWPGRLTTVEQPGAEKGREAAHLVRALLAGEAAHDVTLPTRLRVGDSTAPPRSPAPG